MTTIAIAMPPEQYGAVRIAQLSASVASWEATRCRHQASAHAVLPQQPPWLKILNVKNTNKTQLLPSFHMVDRRKKSINLKTHQGPSTHVLSATSPDPNPYATSQVEVISYILSYQT
jgi:hypothetical protein